MRLQHALPVLISLIGLMSCNGSDGPAYDASIVVPHKDSTLAAVGDTAIKVQADSLSLPAVAAQPGAAGVNPAHGQPGHRCDIAVGAPLNSAPANPSTPVQNVSTTTATPAAPQIVSSTPAKTAPGMNPPHGQPGHRCDISVGAPLKGAPAKPAATATPVEVPSTSEPAPMPQPASTEKQATATEGEKKP